VAATAAGNETAARRTRGRAARTGTKTAGEEGGRNEQRTGGGLRRREAATAADPRRDEQQRGEEDELRRAAPPLATGGAGGRRRGSDGGEDLGQAAARDDGGGSRRAGAAAPSRERIDDGGVEPRWRRPTGKEMGTLLCSLSAAATRSTKEWVWGWKEMPPPGARRSSQGQRSNDEGWRTGSHWSSVTMSR